MYACAMSQRQQGLDAVQALRDAWTALLHSEDRRFHAPVPRAAVDAWGAACSTVVVYAAMGALEGARFPGLWSAERIPIQVFLPDMCVALAHAREGASDAATAEAADALLDTTWAACGRTIAQWWQGQHYRVPQRHVGPLLHARLDMADAFERGVARIRAACWGSMGTELLLMPWGEACHVPDATQIRTLDMLWALATPHERAHLRNVWPMRALLSTASCVAADALRWMLAHGASPNAHTDNVQPVEMAVTRVACFVSVGELGVFWRTVIAQALECLDVLLEHDAEGVTAARVPRHETCGMHGRHSTLSPHYWTAAEERWTAAAHAHLAPIFHKHGYALPPLADIVARQLRHVILHDACILATPLFVKSVWRRRCVALAAWVRLRRGCGGGGCGDGCGDGRSAAAAAAWRCEM